MFILCKGFFIRFSYVVEMKLAHNSLRQAHARYCGPVNIYLTVLMGMGHEINFKDKCTRMAFAIVD